MTFKEKLVILRKSKGLTQDEFASAVGVSRQAVYKWESGQSYPEVPKLLEMKLLFTISIDELLDDNYDLWLYYLGEVKRIVSKTGKPFWFDEWNYGGQAMENQKKDFYAQQVAQTVVAAMNAGVDSMIYWQLFEIVWPTRSSTGGEFIKGIHALGIAPSLYESAIPYKMYYGFSLLAKYAGEKGSKTYAGSSRKGVCCSMVEYVKDGKTYQNVIVVNTTSLEQKISLNFEKSIGKNMYRYMFDPIKVVPTTAAEIISADKGFSNVDTTLQDTIPAGSIVIYSTVKE